MTAEHAIKNNSKKAYLVFIVDIFICNESFLNAKIVKINRL